LTRWKHSPRQDPELIETVQKKLIDLTKVAPRFALAYFNLACVYSEKREFTEATNNLRTFSEIKGDEGLDTLVDFVRRDLTLPSDQFLSNYVRERLSMGNADATGTSFAKALKEKIKDVLSAPKPQN
jgi:hypothetical protein